MSTGTQDPLPPFTLPTPPRRKWPLLVVVVVLLAAAAFGGVAIYDHLQSCGHGVDKTGSADECIGVSDGSFTFEKSLRPVMAKILAENKRVKNANRPWVSVAYVEPITTDPNQEAIKYGIKEELEGAYLAQRQLNDAQLGGRGDLPQIRLLVANIGLRSEQWKPLTDKLIAMTKDGNHLVAVAGFGQSRGGTLDAVKALRAAKVPMMGATVTADGLASADEVGFFSTSSPNADQASGAAGYLRQQQTAKPGYKVLVVRDRNEDDIYNTSLFTDFTRAAAKKQLALMSGDLGYISGIDGSISNDLSSVADRVCDKKPDAVFFAGRGVDLRGFITAMSAAGRRCPVTVLTGDDAVGVYYDASVSDATRRQFQADWRVSGVTALYTALGHPELPGLLYKPANNPYTGFRTLYHQEFGGTGDDDFQDGQVILAHDALWTLGVAIRDAAGDGGTVPVTSGSTLNALLSGQPVSGVSGPIDLGPAGNPQNKPMALVKLEPNGRYTFQAVVRP
ncbi:ABC transporter substrate-binding protein [Streptomyces sp. NPDC051976]|uniref:ABC transporter substrate-binding protein n=1 Tax=Streptomyces sp. NPDC051976 TaxID=3154947 RepID=UPI00341A4BEB